MIRKGKFKGTYNVKIAQAVSDAVQAMNITHKSVLVVGSEIPWVETIALYHGAAHVTTLEYGQIISQHPQITTLTPPEFRQAFLNGTLGMFDAVLSFSSLEHAGLGRYGDALNPWGDVLAVARAWCVTQPAGLLYLGVPTAVDGVDKIQFNAHRWYGKLRWPLLTANWKHLPGIVPSEQNMGMAGTGFLFQKVSVPNRGSATTTATW